jgi:hypothetical protein
MDYHMKLQHQVMLYRMDKTEIDDDIDYITCTQIDIRYYYPNDLYTLDIWFSDAYNSDNDKHYYIDNLNQANTLYIVLNVFDKHIITNDKVDVIFLPYWSREININACCYKKNLASFDEEFLLTIIKKMKYPPLFIYKYCLKNPTFYRNDIKEFRRYLNVGILSNDSIAPCSASPQFAALTEFMNYEKQSSAK